MTAGLSEAIREGANKQIPLGHFGEPSDIAKMVAFLDSEEAKFITGQVIHIDDGMAM